MGTAVTDFRPMLAGAGKLDQFDKKTGDVNWIMEPKHDGMRAVISVDSGLPKGIVITSRTGLDYTDCLLPLHLELLKIAIPDGTTLDGELAFIKDTVKVDSEFVPVVDFSRTMQIMRSNPDRARSVQASAGEIMSYLVFDIVYFEAEQVMTAAWSTRRDMLEAIFAGISSKIDMSEYGDRPPLLLNPSFEVSLETYDAFLEGGVEGALLKNVNMPYVCGKRPSNTWIKLKADATYDVVVSGFTAGQGKYSDQIGAIEFSAYAENGELEYVGRCSGMTDGDRKLWTQVRDLWDEDEHGGTFVIEVKANELTGNGTEKYHTPRHPQYVCIRDDKLPADCTMDQFLAKK